MTITRYLILNLIIINTFFAVAARAQDLQVSPDSEGRVSHVTADMEKSLKLFSEYPGFIEARIFMTNPDEYSLEIIYREAAGPARKKIKLTGKDLSEFRKKFDEQQALTRKAPAADDDGRYILLTASTLYSMSIYGPLLNVIFDVDSAGNFAAVTSLTGSAGFFLPFWLTYDRPVPEAAALAYTYGSPLGMLHGLFAGMLIFGEDGGSGRTVASVVLAAGLAEGIGGFFAAEKLKLSKAQVELAANTSLWGTIWTVEALTIFSDMESIRAGGALLLAGSFGGAYLGWHLSTVEDYSRGDVIVQNVTAVLGAYVPLAVVKNAGSDNSDVYFGASLAGSAAGYTLGYYLIKDKKFSSAQGGLIALGCVAGGLLGQSAAYKFDPGNTSMYLTLSSAGAIAGFSILYYIFHDNADAAGSKDSAFNVHIMPVGLSSLFIKNEKAPSHPGREYASDSVPVFVLEYKL